MYGRTARYTIDPDRCSDAVASFRDAGNEISSLPGFLGGYVLIDSENGEVMTLTLWESREALEASDVRASSARRGAIQAVDGTVEAVARYDVVRDLGSP